MTSRTRRWLFAATALVLLLFAGRWAVGLLASRWWAAALSPAALAVVTRWKLLGLALDAGAIVIASCWFAAQALLVARAIGSVQVERRVGELRVREAVPTRLLLGGAIATGILLGLLTGAGARAWRAPVALAWQGVHYGVNDPLLGVDLGVLVARYPVWRLAHHFALLLVLLGLVFTLLLYLGIGAVRRRGRSLELHPDARRHLGGLLAILALLIAVGYLLAPYRLATTLDVPLAAAAATTRVLAAQAAAGAAIAVAVMSILWALRPRHSLLGAGWAVLALAALAERVVVPAFVAEGGMVRDRDAQVRRYESLFYGIRTVEPQATVDSVPAVTTVWDEAALASWAASRKGTLLAATPTDQVRPTWLLATGFGTSVEVSAIAAGSVDPLGRPHPTGSDSSGGHLMRQPRSAPGREGWQRTDQAVPAGHLLRRLTLAWALQAPGIVGVPASTAVDWQLDPRDRMAALLPALHWRGLGLAILAGEPTWLVGGLVSVEAAPLTARIAFDGDQVAGVVPALVATVRASDGAVRVFADPAADSLGLAWAAVFAPLVEPATEMPEALRLALPYPVAWFEAQLQVMERPTWGLGRRPPLGTTGRSQPPVPVWGVTGPALQAVFEDPSNGTPATLVEASRRGGMAVATIQRLDAGELPGTVELSHRWARLAGMQRLADSVKAAGDTVIAGPVRWELTADGLVAWQAIRSGGRRAEPTLLWLATARGPAVGGARRPREAWAALGAEEESVAGAAGADAMARLEAIRGWVRRADSALARRDMTAFGRAWEALRGLLPDTSRQ